MIYRLLAYPHIVPVLMQVFYTAAIIRYAFARDWGRCWYWAGALIINGAVTFGRPK